MLLFRWEIEDCKIDVFFFVNFIFVLCCYKNYGFKDEDFMLSGDYKDYIQNWWDDLYFFLHSTFLCCFMKLYGWGEWHGFFFNIEKGDVEWLA